MVIKDVRKWGRAADPDDTREELRRLAEAQSIRELIEISLPHNDKKELYETLRKF